MQDKDLDPDTHERCRFLVAEVLAALSRVDDAAVTPPVAEVVGRARKAGKELVRALGGRSEDSAPAPAFPAVEDDLIGYHLLVTVADPAVRQAIAAALQSRGARLALARDACEAEDMAAGLAIDLTLIGPDLPDATLAEAVAQLAPIRNAGSSPAPILALVEPGTGPALEGALRTAGAKALMRLPHDPATLDPAALIAAVGATLASHAAALQDEPRFRRLMEIAGPDGRGELLMRLQEDLERSADDLALALQHANKADLRNATHVLIALAGAVGATDLQAHAEELNRAAHQDAPLQPGTSGARALRALGRLIAYIEVQRQL